jgi:hypothetical protein
MPAGQKELVMFPVYLECLTVLKGLIRCLQQTSLLRVQCRRLLGARGKERGIKALDIFFNEVTTSDIHLKRARSDTHDHIRMSMLTVPTWSLSGW